MNLWDRLKSAAQIVRQGEASPAINNSGPLISSSDPAVLDFFNPPNVFAGTTVNPETAMKVSSVFACARLIAGAVATLPLPIYKTGENDVRESVPDHPVKYLLNTQPTARFTAASWIEFAVTSMLLRGDAFAVIIRDRAGNPKELVPMPAQNVVVERRDDRLVYLMHDNFNSFGLEQDDVLHFPGFGFNGLRSMSVIRYAALQSIGTAIATENFAGNFFTNGATPKVVIQSPNDMDDTQIERLRNVWATRYGGVENSNKPLILYGGMVAKELSLSAEDAQLLGSRGFQVEDIARAFGVPPHMIGHTDKNTSWGSGIEQMGQGFVIYTLLPHLTRIEQEINRKLFRISRYFVEFNKNGLLQADAKGRAAYYREAIGGSQGPGWMTANEIRRIDNLPPLAGGDERYVAQNAAPATPAKAKEPANANP